MPTWCRPLRPFHAYWVAVQHGATAPEDALCSGCSMASSARDIASGSGNTSHRLAITSRTSKDSSCADSSMATNFDSSMGTTPSKLSATADHDDMAPLGQITSIESNLRSGMHVEHWLTTNAVQLRKTQHGKSSSSRLVQHGKTLLIATGAVTLGHMALPASAVWMKGTRWTGTATRMAVFYLGGKLLLHKNRYRDLPNTPTCISDVTSDGNSPQQPSAMTVLDMAHLPWMNEDNAYRILVNEGHDLKKARGKATAMHMLRTSIGLDLIQYPDPNQDMQQQQSQHSSNRKRSTFQSYFNSKGGVPKEGIKQSAASPAKQGNVGQTMTTAAGLQQACPAWQAAQRFPEVARALGGSLVHIDEKVGRAVLWVEGRKLANVKADMCSVLGIDPHTTTQQHNSSSTTGSHSQQQPAWQAAAAVHVAVMSDWLWRAKLPGFPLEAGRHVQVVDLKGLRVAAALGDGLAVLRAIMAAATQFPQRLEATLIINPPAGLTLAWNIIAQLLPHAVAAKIKFVRGSGQKLMSELLRYMPQDMIPAEYGGGWSGPMADHPAQKEIETALKQSVLLNHIQQKQ